MFNDERSKMKLIFGVAYWHLGANQCHCGVRSRSLWHNFDKGFLLDTFVRPPSPSIPVLRECALRGCLIHFFIFLHLFVQHVRLSASRDPNLKRHFISP